MKNQHSSFKPAVWWFQHHSELASGVRGERLPTDFIRPLNSGGQQVYADSA